MATVVWDPLTFSEETRFATTEIWEDKKDGAVTSSFRYVNRDITSDNELTMWVQGRKAKQEAKQKDPSSPRPTRKCLLRVAWLQCDSKQQKVTVKEDDLNRLLTGTKMQGVDKQAEKPFAGLHYDCFEGSYCFSDHPHTLVLWSGPHPTTVVCIAVPEKIVQAQRIVQSSKIQELAADPMFPALIFATAMTYEVDNLLVTVKDTVEESEVHIVHPDRYPRVERPPFGNLYNVVAAMSGSLTRLAHTTREFAVLQKLICFARNPCSCSMCEREDCDEKWPLHPDFVAIERQTRLRQLDVEYLRCRVQTQRKAIVHAIAANESNTTSDIVNSSRVLAQVSQGISVGLHVLAAIGVCFLPVAFISSLLDLPLFGRLYSDKSMLSFGRSKQAFTKTSAKENTWRTYLVICIVMIAMSMFLTYLTWRLWTHISNGRSYKTKSPDLHLELSAAHTEEEDLAQKRDLVSEEATSANGYNKG